MTFHSAKAAGTKRFLVPYPGHGVVMSNIAEEYSEFGRRACSAMHRLELGRTQQTGASAFTAILDETLKLHGAAHGKIHLVRPGGLELVAHKGFPARHVEAFQRLRPTPNSACGWAIHRRVPIVIEDIHRIPELDVYKRVADAIGFRAVLSAPAFGPAKTLVGTLSAHFDSPHKLSRMHVHIMSMFAHQVARIAVPSPPGTASLKSRRMPDLIDVLRLCRRHQTQALTRIIKQQLLIDRLEQHGHPTGNADRLLGVMMDALHQNLIYEVSLTRALDIAEAAPLLPEVPSSTLHDPA